MTLLLRTGGGCRVVFCSRLVKFARSGPADDMNLAGLKYRSNPGDYMQIALTQQQGSLT